MIKQILVQTIEQTVNQLFPAAQLGQIELTHPTNEAHGDYSTNVAMILARQLGQSPLQIAQQIAAALPSQPAIAEVQAVAPGFINFRLYHTYYIDQLQAITTLGDTYGQPVQTSGQQILFEFGCPNTHKVPHIGHLYSYCYGESCARLLKLAGHTVYRDNYQGDVGLHVAKCLWAYQKYQQPDPESLDAKVQYLQECYQQGAQAYEDDEQIKQEIDELNRAIYLKDVTVMADWEKTRQWSLDYYRQFEQRLGVHYDKFYLESQTSVRGLEIVKAHVDQVFEEDQGAIIFRGEKFGLHTRVFVNRFGNPTYEAKDIGLAALKKEDFTFDQSVYTTAVEQNEYWQVVIKAIETVFPDLVGRLTHIGYGMVNLTTGKMSSRTGQIVTGTGLVEMVKERVKEYIVANRDYTSDEVEAIAEKVAIGAVKYSFLKSAAGKNITFDLESSIAIEGNSGPYLQYTYARCQSLLRKAADQAADLDVTALTLNNDELAILRWLYRFPEVVEAAAADHAPHVMCNYLFELAQRFSYFYNEHQVLTDDPQITQFRLQLTAAVAQILKTGLFTLGIEVSEQV